MIGKIIWKLTTVMNATCLISSFQYQLMHVLLQSLPTNTKCNQLSKFLLYLRNKMQRMNQPVTALTTARDSRDSQPNICLTAEPRQHHR
jgi:hypothetical protein